MALRKLHFQYLLFFGQQVAAVREGMSWIVPVPLLSLLTAKQLEQMVCGMPEISVEVLKKVVRYREVDEQHQLVQWFWHTLEEFSNEERVLFMRFVSGRSRLPANTADISQRFQIMKVDRVRFCFLFCIYSYLVLPVLWQKETPFHNYKLTEKVWDGIRSALVNPDIFIV